MTTAMTMPIKTIGATNKIKMATSKTIKIADKEDNNQDPSTCHKIDLTSKTDRLPKWIDNKSNKVSRRDNGCKVDSSRKENWIYKFLKLRKQRPIMNKGTTKQYRIKEMLAYKTEPEHET